MKKIIIYILKNRKLFLKIIFKQTLCFDGNCWKYYYCTYRHVNCEMHWMPKLSTNVLYQNHMVHSHIIVRFLMCNNF